LPSAFDSFASNIAKFVRAELTKTLWHYIFLIKSAKAMHKKVDPQTGGLLYSRDEGSVEVSAKIGQFKLKARLCMTLIRLPIILLVIKIIYAVTM
jgi:hypothetical protein